MRPFSAGLLYLHGASDGIAPWITRLHRVWEAAIMHLPCPPFFPAIARGHYMGLDCVLVSHVHAISVRIGE